MYTDKDEITKRGQKTLITFLFNDKRKEPPKIIVDQRERSSQLVGKLTELGAVLQFKTLKVGDYVISENVAIERKTFNDFAGSIVDRRLFEQIRAMKEAYSSPILLLEGKGPTTRGLSEEALRGALVSVILDFGIPILWVEDTKEAAKFLMTIARREQGGTNRDVNLKDRKRPKTPDEEKEYVVASLPFVESATAKRLLLVFKTVEAIFSASEKELMEVEGIGPKKARRIREIASIPYTVKLLSDEPSPVDRAVKRGS
jgi:Fanconi anemia group M protein